MTAGEKSVQAFLAWRATMKDCDFEQITFRGQLNRTEVAKGCNIAKAALRQNPEVKAQLEQLECELRDREVLPPLTASAEAAKDHPKHYDRTATKRAREAQRVAQLEQQVLELKARLRRFEELSEVIAEMGIEI